MSSVVTLKEIASACGCSTATVSKALNALPDIGEKRKAEIRKAASEMGYRPNLSARTLKTSRSMTVGLLMYLGSGSAWVHEYYGQISWAIQRELNKSDYDLIPIDCHLQMSSDEFVARALAHNYDGVIIMNYGRTHERIRKLAKTGIPIVAIDEPYDIFDSVSSDNTSGICQMIRYAVSLGHRRIALLHGDDGYATRKRIEAFRTEMAAEGIPVIEEYILDSDYRDVETCQKVVAHLLDMENPPTCIFCPDDFAMIGALNEARERNLRVPEDISLGGYDGNKFSKAVKPNFTTVEQDADEIGKLAAQMVLSKIKEPEKQDDCHMMVPCKFIPGGTIGKVKE